MPTPLADSPRLHLQVADVLRNQAEEAVKLARLSAGDAAALDASAAILARVSQTARALGLAHVERAAARARRGLGSRQAAGLLAELLEVCTGGARVAPMLRPIAVVTGGRETEALHRQALLTSASVRLVPDLPTLADLQAREALGAVVVPAALLSQSAEFPVLHRQLLLATGREDDLQARLLASRCGAAQYLPEPLELRLAVQRARAHLAAWHHRAWRVLVAERTRDRVEDLAAALGNEEIVTIPAVGGAKLIEAVERSGPDLVVVRAPLDHMPVSDLTALLRGHHRFGGLPLLFLWEGGIVPAALTGHDVVQGELDVAALRARVLAALDDHRRESGRAEMDELTGVLAAGAVLNAADREIATARRRGESLVAVRLELANPGAIEADAGPMGVATALRLLAGTAQRAVRETDSLGVISETGLVLVMPACSASLARARLQGVRHRFAERLAGAGIPGAAGFHVGLAEGVDDVLLRAELALHRARAPQETAAGPLGGAASMRVGPDLG